MIAFIGIVNGQPPTFILCINRRVTRINPVREVDCGQTRQNTVDIILIRQHAIMLRMNLTLGVNTQCHPVGQRGTDETGDGDRIAKTHDSSETCRRVRQWRDSRPRLHPSLLPGVFFNPS